MGGVSPLSRRVIGEKEEGKREAGARRERKIDDAECSSQDIGSRDFKLALYSLALLAPFLYDQGTPAWGYNFRP